MFGRLEGVIDWTGLRPQCTLKKEKLYVCWREIHKEGIKFYGKTNDRMNNIKTILCGKTELYSGVCMYR